MQCHLEARVSSLMDSLIRPVARGLFPSVCPQLGGLSIPSEGLEPVMPRPAADIARVPRPCLLLLSQEGQALFIYPTLPAH